MDFRQCVSIECGSTYAIDLSSVDQTQVLYHGKFSYLSSYENPHSGSWCHLLVLRSKSPYSKQLLAIITQVPDPVVSIVNTIEHIATFAVNFFHLVDPRFPREDESGDELIGMTPENTIFVEYLPAKVWPGHEKDTFAVMKFLWEKKQFGQHSSYDVATSPEPHTGMWRNVRLETINDLIARL